MPELCPFCSKPIMREYGSFRCKSCARSSEDVLDLERKERAAAVRKAQRAAKAADKAPAVPKNELLALAIARHKERKREGAPVEAAVAPPARAARKRARPRT